MTKVYLKEAGVNLVSNPDPFRGRGEGAGFESRVNRSFGIHNQRWHLKCYYLTQLHNALGFWRVEPKWIRQFARPPLFLPGAKMGLGVREPHHTQGVGCLLLIVM